MKLKPKLHKGILKIVALNEVKLIEIFIFKKKTNVFFFLYLRSNEITF